MLAQIAEERACTAGGAVNAGDARRLIQQCADRHDTVRLHSATGFLEPADMLGVCQAEIRARQAITSRTTASKLIIAQSMNASISPPR